MDYIKIPIDVFQGLVFEQKIVYVMVVIYNRVFLILLKLCEKNYFIKVCLWNRFFFFVTLYTTYRMLGRVFLKLYVK